MTAADAGRRVALPLLRDPAAWQGRLAARWSDRRLAAGPVTASALGKLLACLCPVDLAGEGGGEPKYLYPSAGGLYPVQTYVYLRPGRVAEIAAGSYYHDPAANRLVELAAATDLDPAIPAPWADTPAFESCAFALFLVADLAAIEPMYGSDSLAFSRLEAGYLSQLLTTMAPRYGLGLVPFGGLDPGLLAPLFELAASHLPVHALAGGRLGTGAPDAGSPIEELLTPAIAGPPVGREEGAI